MKIEISSGCTAFYTKIDDKMVHEMSDEELKIATDEIFVKLREAVDRNETSLDSVIGCIQYDDTDYDDYVCDSCGDSVNRTYWNI